MTLDYCAYSSGQGIGAHLIDIMAKNLAQHGNLIQPCPLQHYLYLKNYRVDFSGIPFLIPTGEYSFRTITYKLIDKEELFLYSITAFLEIKRK